MSTFNEDEYQSNILNEYLDNYDYDVSNCCGVRIDGDESDLCPKCKEHCEIISIGDYNYDRHEEAMCDAADSDKELRRLND